MSALAKVIEGFSKLRVMVIGDLMVDAYTWGKVSRISPEARQAAGISEGLLRIAVGLEHIDDIKADLVKGLKS